MLTGLQVGDVQRALGSRVGNGWKEKGERQTKRLAHVFVTFNFNELGFQCLERGELFVTFNFLFCVGESLEGL